MNASSYGVWLELAGWYGLDIADLITKANNLGPLADRRGDLDFDELTLWDVDPELTLVIGDLIDVESLLALGGCLDAG